MVMRIAALLVAGVALLPAAAYGHKDSSHAPEAGEIRAAGDALIASSGDPAAFSLEESARRLILIRHRASGFTCGLPVVRSKWLRMTRDSRGPYVECGYQAAAMGEIWRIRPNHRQASVDEHFRAWRDEVLENNAAHGARILDAEQPIESHDVIEAIRDNVAAISRSGWMTAGEGSQTVWIYFGVTDIGPWRITYFSDGRPDAVRALAPMSWATMLSQVSTAIER